MLVRAIEFQESFARVPVEQARQQHVLLREPDLARDQAARVNAEQNLLDLSRPVSPTETEGAIIDPEQRQASERRSKQQQRREPLPQPPHDGTRMDVRSPGTHIDLIA